MTEKKKDEKVTEEQKKVFHKSDLELVRINRDSVRYRVLNPEGCMADIDHVQFARNGFPKDEEFNMDFITRDISGDRPAEDEKALKALRTKQKAFRKYLHMSLEITANA